jgi:DNA-binding transcriptional ArsR family regulator
MPGQDFIVVPDAASITVALEPAHSAVNSLLLLIKAEDLSGLSDWVTRTVDALTPAERRQHQLVIIGFHYAVRPEQSWSSFPAYVDHLAALDPVALRDKMLAVYASVPPLAEGEEQSCFGEPYPVDWESVLKDVDSYLGFLRERFCAEYFDEELETQAYAYVVDPPAMQDLIVSHLHKMWDEYLAPEWERALPMLQGAVQAFQQVDFSDMNRLEAARLVTGREQEEEKWGQAFEEAERIIFAPTPHVGPYLGKFCSGDTLWVLFGARLPEGVQFHAPDLSRADIVVRLSALADDNRLRILELVSGDEELSSQDIMANLGFSQSAASRHLKQLSATGYLSERRCNGAKCYRLNAERVEDTLRAVSSFLLGR